MNSNDHFHILQGDTDSQPQIKMEAKNSFNGYQRDT